MALASSSRSFALPRVVAASRSFSSSSVSAAPYRTSTGQEAVLPIFSPQRIGRKGKTIYPDFEFVDYRDRQALVYPFSNSHTVPFLPPMPAPRSPLEPPLGNSLMQAVNHNLTLTGDPNSFWFQFSKKHNTRDYIRIGSVVTVSSWTTMAKERSVTFTGVLLAIRRRGTATSFDLRNVVLRTGVQMRFHCSSPLLKEIKVVKRADSKPGNIKRSKKSKLYNLRERPELLLPAIQAVKEGRRIKIEAGTAFA